jgi:hypothetical protein
MRHRHDHLAYLARGKAELSFSFIERMAEKTERSERTTSASFALF